jgi:hypothetical protein
VRATGEGLLPLRTEVRLVEVLVRPAVFAAKLEQLTTGSETTSLTVEVYAKGEGEGGAEVSGRRAIRETSAFGKKRTLAGERDESRATGAGRRRRRASIAAGDGGDDGIERVRRACCRREASAASRDDDDALRRTDDTRACRIALVSPAKP